LTQAVQGVFEHFCKSKKGVMIPMEFFGMLTMIDEESIYGHFEKEQLFAIFDKNHSERITDKEFYRIILQDQFAEMLLNRSREYFPELRLVHEEMQRRRESTLPKMFGVADDNVPEALFTETAAKIGMNVTNARYKDFLRVFEDSEKARCVNLDDVSRTHPDANDDRSHDPSQQQSRRSDLQED
jgi:hypothetical protein